MCSFNIHTSQLRVIGFNMFFWTCLACLHVGGVTFLHHPITTRKFLELFSNSSLTSITTLNFQTRLSINKKFSKTPFQWQCCHFDSTSTTNCLQIFNFFLQISKNKMQFWPNNKECCFGQIFKKLQEIRSCLIQILGHLFYPKSITQQ